MEGCPKALMISYDTKEALPAEFTQALQNYIQEYFQENPESYKNEIQQINQLRKNISITSRDNQGCSSLKKYFAQLQFLQSRFPMFEGGAAAVAFAWYDVYIGEPVMRKDIRYEQACVLFNLGGLYSQLGANEGRLTDESMKVACTYFQCAAGVFQYLRENFLLDTLSDMAPEILHLKEMIMLGQAQECLLEKSIRDNRKNTLIARISIQIKNYFEEAVKLLDSNGTSEMGSPLRKSWTRHLQLKISTYYALANVYMSNEADQDQKFGDKVGYLKAAANKMNEALKTAKNQPAQVLETLNFVKDVVGNKFEAAVKENDFVYHAAVPEIDKLPEISGVCLVKAMPFQFDDRSVSGPDIFERLIPMRAHEASSLYSEEKASLLRAIDNEIEDKNIQLSESLSSMHIDDLMNPVDESLPENLLQKRQELLNLGDPVTSTADQIIELAKLSEEFDVILNRISMKLNSEEKFARETIVKDNQTNIINELENLKVEFAQCTDVNEKATKTNTSLCDHFEQSKDIIEILIGPVDQISSSLPSQDVIEAPAGEAVVQRVRELLGAVDKMKIQRADLEKQLREKLNKDDITSLLVVKEDGNREEFFKDQLKKHDELITIIRQNLNAQDGILLQLTEANAKYAPTRVAAHELSVKREEQIQSYVSHATVFLEVREKLGRGLSFYKDLKDNILKLDKKMTEFCQKREKERGKYLDERKKEVPPSRPNAPKPAFSRDLKPTGLESGSISTTEPRLLPNTASMIPSASIPMQGPRPVTVGMTPGGAFPGDGMGVPRTAQDIRMQQPIAQQPVRPLTATDGLVPTNPTGGGRPKFIISDQMGMPQFSAPASSTIGRFTIPGGVRGQLPAGGAPGGIQATQQGSQLMRAAGQEGNISRPMMDRGQLPSNQPMVTNQEPRMHRQQIGTEEYPNQVRPQHFSARGQMPTNMDGQLFNRPPNQLEKNQMIRMRPMNVDQSRFPMEQPIRSNFHPEPGHFQANQMQPLRQNLVQPQPPIQFHSQQDNVHPSEVSKIPFVSYPNAGRMHGSPQSTGPGQIRLPPPGTVHMPPDSNPRLQDQMVRGQFRPMQNPNLILRQQSTQIPPQRPMIASQFVPRQNRPMMPGQGVQRMPIEIQNQRPLPGQQDFYSQSSERIHGATFLRQDSGEIDQYNASQSVLSQSTRPGQPQQMPQRQYPNQEQQRYHELPEPMQPMRMLPEPLLPDKIGSEAQRMQRRSSTDNETAIALQHRSAGKSYVIDSSEEALQRRLSSSQQPMQIIGNRIESMQDDALSNTVNPALAAFSQSSTWQCNNAHGPPMHMINADVQTGAGNMPRPIQPDDKSRRPLMTKMMQRPSFEQPEMPDENFPNHPINASGMNPSKYAFQGPISNSLSNYASTITSDYSTVTSSVLNITNRSPSAPLQPVSIENPGSRNLPPFSPTQVFDPVTMNNRPVMAASQSGNNVIASVLGASTVQPQKNYQPDSIQSGLQQFQVQQLLLQQQQLITMIQSQQNQQRASESMQIEKLQMQLIDQQRYIDQLANEQHKLHNKKEVPEEQDRNQLLFAQFQQQIHAQNELLKQQQQQLEQLRRQSSQIPQKPAEEQAVGTANDEKRESSVLADNKASKEAAPTTDISTVISRPIILSDSHLPGQKETITTRKTESDDKVLKSKDLDDYVSFAQSVISSAMVSGSKTTIPHSAAHDDSKREGKDKLLADLDDFERDMDAVLSGTVSNTLMTPTSNDVGAAEHSDLRGSTYQKHDEPITSELRTDQGKNQITASTIPSKNTAIVHPETNFPFYEPMLDKEQDLRLRQINTNVPGTSESNHPDTGENSHLTDAIGQSLIKQSAEGDKQNVAGAYVDSFVADETHSSASSDSFVNQLPTDNVKKQSDDSHGKTHETNKETSKIEEETDDIHKETDNIHREPDYSKTVSQTGPKIEMPFADFKANENLMLPDDPSITCVGAAATIITSEDKIIEKEKTSEKSSFETPNPESAIKSSDNVRITSPVPTVAISEAANSDESTTRPHLERQEGRLSFYQASGKEEEQKAYLIDLDTTVENMHKQCMTLCKKIQGLPIDGFTQMWNDLAQVEELDSCSYTIDAGKKNVNKNRYRDILPWDHTRVILSSLPNDYINASHVKELTALSPHYIASQGPIPQCFGDFWTMIWEQHCSVIVMLTNEVEGTKLKCHPYWPRKLEQATDYGDIRVCFAEQESFTSWKNRKFLITNLKTNESRAVTQCQFTAWPDYGIPNTPYDLLSFIEEVRCYYEVTDKLSVGPLLLHCSAGVGRTGTFACIYSAIQEINGGNGLVEIPGLIRKLRQCRFHMVQRKEQLIFCYQAILCYAQQFLAEEQLKQQTKGDRGLSVTQLEDDVIIPENANEKMGSGGVSKEDEKKEHASKRSYDDESLTQTNDVKLLGDTEIETSQVSQATSILEPNADDFSQIEPANDERAIYGRDRADSIPKFKVNSGIFSSRSPPPSPGIRNDLQDISDQI